MGLRLGKGEKLSDITAGMNAVAEGVLTSKYGDLTRWAHNMSKSTTYHPVPSRLFGAGWQHRQIYLELRKTILQPAGMHPCCRSANEFAKKLGLEAPIIEGIYRVIHEGADPVAVVTEVMSRELRPEVDEQIMLAAAKK